jgi:mannose-6-phosphate isomerase-like protein (cupin superfamily)
MTGMTADDAVRNLDRILASFDEAWAPRVVAHVNDWAVKIARLHGDYVWHAHPDTDEVFLVIDGTLDIALRDGSNDSADSGGSADDSGIRTVHLGRNDVYVVPRGVEHRPSAPHGAVALLVEPADTVSTGDYPGDVPAHITSTTGLPPG